MHITGNLRKLYTELENPVKYYLDFNGERVNLNNYIGKTVSLEFTGEINCIKCGRLTKKSFSQGFCYPCFKSSPETEECVLRPELCKAHEGIARDIEFAKNNCLINHIVYLSVTSGLKVGVTRNTQIPTRWIDQGAVQAIKLAVTPNRFIAGQIEVSLKEHMADKTNWRNMLTNKINEQRNLSDIKNIIIPKISNSYSEYIVNDSDIINISYPHIMVPEKVTSVNFDKNPLVKGRLTGIKGQYIILNNQLVLNIRKFGGYKINFTAVIN